VADAGYRGHNAPRDYKIRVFTAGQKRRVTPQIKRDFRRRATIIGTCRRVRHHSSNTGGLNPG
jgi:hypothetical protein